MKKTLLEIETLALGAAHKMALPRDSAADAAGACVFLESVGYPGLKLLLEAAGERGEIAKLQADALGLDLQNVSCVFLGRQLEIYIKAHGRVFLRNVRHGLYLLPLSVRLNVGIGCPVDPSFALGGERHKNPYTEKLAVAARDGISVDEAIWSALENL